MPFFTDRFGNPHANTYVRALHARRAVEDARQDVAAAVGARARDIVFTSGATESNNLAVLGITAVQGNRRRVVTQATEHRSILDPITSLLDGGFEVITVGVGRDGVVDLAALRQAVNAGTLLVSIRLVNNETGVIQPIAEIAEICQEAGVLLHCDCAQALGRVPVNVKVLGVDFASFSAHKSYGPKGIWSAVCQEPAHGPHPPDLPGWWTGRGITAWHAARPVVCGVWRRCPARRVRTGGIRCAGKAAPRAPVDRHPRGCTPSPPQRPPREPSGWLPEHLFSWCESRCPHRRTRRA